MKPFSLILLLVAALPAYAGREGNGGNETALEFRAFAALAADRVKRNPQVYPEAASVDLSGLLARAKVLVVQTPLFVRRGEVVQESTAVNYAETETVLVHQARWDAIHDMAAREALALHELLSLAGLETTAEYPLSGRYLTARGSECSSGLCDGPAGDQFSPVRFHAICFGEASGTCVNAPDNAHAGDHYAVMGGGTCEFPRVGLNDLFMTSRRFDNVHFTCDAAGVRKCQGALRSMGKRAGKIGIGTDGRCYSIER